MHAIYFVFILNTKHFRRYDLIPAFFIFCNNIYFKLLELYDASTSEIFCRTKFYLDNVALPDQWWATCTPAVHMVVTGLPSRLVEVGFVWTWVTVVPVSKGPWNLKKNAFESH